MGVEVGVEERDPVEVGVWVVERVPVEVSPEVDPVKVVVEGDSKVAADVLGVAEVVGPC
jgi:hypothetical protein